MTAHDSRTFIRWAGMAAAVGGALWIMFTVLVAARPSGCVGGECASRPMRNSGDLAFLLLAAGVLIAAGFVGLMVRARAMDRVGRLWRWSAVLAVVGAVSAVIGTALNPISDNAPPFLVVPGVIALALGLFLVAIEVFRVKALPRWASLLLIVSAVSLVGTNEQNARILFMTPFGVAWLLIGVILWRDAARLSAGQSVGR